MKKQMVLMIAMALMAGACGFHTKENKEVPQPETQAPKVEDLTLKESKDLEVRSRAMNSDPQFKEALKKIEKGNYELGEQAKAGSVIFSGVIASEAAVEKKLEIHQQIKINLDSDLNFVRAMSEEELVVVNQVINRKTFINIGCGKLPVEQTAGLTEVKMKLQRDFAHAHANKVFLCGKGVMSRSHAIVYADEVVMNGASFIFPKSTGVVNICTKTLTLIGDNKLKTMEKQINSLDKPGSPVFLSVLETLKGSGTLEINQ